ncbi:MAG: hypothetical protein U5K79_10345 [Cyclobacteriaceae bacterium]|nr:hypothetical protein [Cyclobacteriaceae bacterium]
MRYFIIISFTFFQLLFSSYNSHGQNFGGNSWNQRWRQINTDTVRVIYPAGIEPQAQKVANMVHAITKNHTHSIGDLQKKIDIVLQNRTVISNGYVGLAPFRSELFLNAPQDPHQIGANWDDVLTIHEYRHALQFANSRRGLTKFVSYLTGQAGWGAMARLSIPDWFWEGDAVMSETALTGQGRGRLPAFYNDYKSLWLDSISYNYQKARNGSIKDFVPNEYNLGFLLTNYGRVTYGDEFWRDVIKDSGKYRGLFYPFSQAIRRRTGHSTKGWYSEAQTYYKEINAIIPSTRDAVVQINKVDKKQTFTSYEYPAITKEGNLLALIHSYKRIPAIYEIDSLGHETKIVTIGRAIDYYFTHRNGKLLWSELGNDERWSWETYSNIIIYDIEQQARQRLTHNSRFMSPDLSPDGKAIIAYEYKPDRSGTLVIISSENGEVKKRIDNPEGYYFSYPKWSENGQQVVVVARNVHGLSTILRVDTQAGIMDALMPFTNHQIGIPVEAGNFIYFSASFSGVDNIYSLDKETRKIAQQTDGALGSYHPFVNRDSGTIYFSRFSSLGSNIFSISPWNVENKEVDVIEPAEMETYSYLDLDKEGSDITEAIPGHVFKSKKYSQATKLINIHSWSWLFADPTFEWALRSNNILNTFALDAGMRYNSNEKGWGYFTTVSYAQLYPVINFTYGNQWRSFDFSDHEPIDPNDPLINSGKIYWRETNLKAGLLLPIDLSAGLYKRSLNVISNYSYFSNNYQGELDDFSFNALENGITLLNRRVKARQNILAKNSQYLFLVYKNDIGSSDKETYARQFHFDSEWTFGGLSANHNIMIQAAYKSDKGDGYRFSDNFLYSRGYGVPFYDNITKFSANYHMPLTYPDWGFWGIIYLYRIRSNVFFDYSRTLFSIESSNTESTQLYNSAGLELVFDTRLFNYYDFSVGVRYAHLLNDDFYNPELKNVFEVFVPILRF